MARSASTARTGPPTTPRKRATKVVPKPLSVKVNYSIGIKVNLGNYESADLHVSETQEFDVTGLSPEAMVVFADATRAEIAARLSDEVVAKAVLARGVEEEDEDGNPIVRRRIT